MRTLKDYIKTIPLHQAEGRYWSQVDHTELIEWQKTLEKYELLIENLRQTIAMLEQEQKSEVIDELKYLEGIEYPCA